MSEKEYYQEGQQTMNMLAKSILSNVLILIAWFLLPNKWFIIPLMFIIPIFVFTTLRSKPL